jgi:hypothetical protein
MTKNQSGHLGGQSPRGRGQNPQGEWSPARNATGDNDAGSKGDKCAAPEDPRMGNHVGRGAGRRSK